MYHLSLHYSFTHKMKPCFYVFPSPMSTRFLAKLIADLYSICNFTSRLTSIFSSLSTDSIRNAWHAQMNLLYTLIHMMIGLHYRLFLRTPRDWCSKKFEDVTSGASSINLNSRSINIRVTINHCICLLWSFWEQDTKVLCVFQISHNSSCCIHVWTSKIIYKPAFYIT